VFGQARWRFTLWFTVALGVILLLIGAAVYFTTRAVLFDQVDSDLESRTGQEQRLLTPRLRGGFRGGAGQDIVIGPTFTTGGYFYALTRSDGEVVASTPNADPNALAGEGAILEALADGEAFVDTSSSEGDSLRVFVRRLDGPLRGDLLLQVGRSTEPERQALQRLLVVLAGGLGVGLGLSLVGGYFLAGRALRPIRSAMDSQREFIADASHELRTPLAVVRANAELLKRHEAEPVSANMEAVDDIVGQSDKLGRLVGQMLTLARVDSGQAGLARAEVALAEVAEEAARGMRLLAEQQGVALEAKLDASVRLQGDSDRLRELLVVLLDNGIKYTDAGGKVTLEVRGKDGHATVRVADTGRGIPAEALPHVFDRFYRVDKARSREAGGTGLGLAIARWIAEAHGGSIRAESAPGVGTTMTVELPAS
jgi:two-component system sensor histidine kinase CiaH